MSMSFVMLIPQQSGSHIMTTIKMPNYVGKNSMRFDGFLIFITYMYVHTYNNVIYVRGFRQIFASYVRTVLI